MGLTLLISCPRGRVRAPHAPHRGASLIELLVVLFIMGIMMGMLLPAVNNARNQAQAKVCQNNIYQLEFALGRAIDAKKRVPLPGQWTFEVLPYIEQVPLYQLMKQNREPNPKFPRPPLLRCPMQDDVPSRVETVGYSHYVLVIDRYPNGEMERDGHIQDLPLPDGDVDPEPWYVAPEMRYQQREFLFAEKPGPHPPGMYMTERGPQPNAP
jgi:prepilin-type N-terminal cleavage/methylation domain-containing protein